MFLKVHSTESFGTVDGPGIRMVIFLQGCPLRCLYCHNPDSWEINAGKEMSAEEIIAEFNKNRDFYKNGGITVSGGEPLLQIEAVTELFELAKENGIHTCIDTSGAVFLKNNKEHLSKIDRLLKSTDLVMLDIKHIDFEKHKKLTGSGNKAILDFARHLDKRGVDIWIRHVVVEGYTDNYNDLVELGRFIGSLSHLRALDVIPYHTMGVSKYEQLHIDYPLKHLSALSISAAQNAKMAILKGVKETRVLNKK